MGRSFGFPEQRAGTVSVAKAAEAAPVARLAPRRYDRRMIHIARVLAACAVVALAGCAQSNSSADLAPAAPQAAPAQQAAPAAPPPKVALTPEEAKAQCWMKYEGDKRVKNIDARLTLVEKCVDDTLRGQLVQGPQR
jgi:uncharacterized lipoprotein YajG